MRDFISSFTVLEPTVQSRPPSDLLEPGVKDAPGSHRLNQGVVIDTHTQRRLHTYIESPSIWTFSILTVSTSKGISQSSLVYIHLHYQCQTCPPTTLSLRVSVRYSLHRIIDWSNGFMLSGCPYPRNDTSVQLRNNGGGLVLLQDTQLIETLAHFSRERIPERYVDCLLNSCHSYL